MTTYELIEKYIDTHDGEREYVEKLTFEEQILYKCMLRDSLSFTLWALGTLIGELANATIEGVTGLFNWKERKQKKSDDISEDTPREYIEQDTTCDNCHILYHCVEEGLVVESTTGNDMRRHYIPIPGGYCPGFVGDRKYAFKEMRDDDR